MQTKNYSIQAFQDFLQKLPELNIVNEATARNLRDSSLRLLSVLGPDAECADIRDLSVINMANDYSESADNKPSDASLQAYKSRMQSAIDKFISHQGGENDMTEKKSIQSKEKRKVGSRKKTITVQQPAVKTFELPIPLRGDLIVTIGNLPRDLTKEEAKRISLIVESFAMIDDLNKE